MKDKEQLPLIIQPRDIQHRHDPAINSLIESVSFFKKKTDTNSVGTHYTSLDDLIRFYPDPKTAKQCVAGQGHAYRVPYDINGDKKNRIYLNCMLSAGGYDPMSPTKIKTNDDIYKSGVQFAHSKYALASINECRVLEAIKFLLAHKYEFEGDMITSDRSGAISLITSYAEIRKTLQSELNIALNSVQIAEALQILLNSQLTFRAERNASAKDGMRAIMSYSGGGLIASIEELILQENFESVQTARSKRSRLKITLNPLITESITSGDYKHFNLLYRSSLDFIGQHIHKKLVRHFTQAKAPENTLSMFSPGVKKGEYIADEEEGIAWPIDEDRSDDNTIQLYGRDGAYMLKSKSLMQEGITVAKSLKDLGYKVNKSLKQLEGQGPDDSGIGIVHAWARVTNFKEKETRSPGRKKLDGYTWFIWATEQFASAQMTNNYCSKNREKLPEKTVF